MCDENGNAIVGNNIPVISGSDCAAATVRLATNLSSPISSTDGQNLNFVNGNGHVQQQVYQMALLSQMMKVKDPTWLQLEVCRDYQRRQCTRTEHECKFSHPPANVEIQNGRVTSCYESLKNRCKRPICKYLHPPQHLKEQVLINGQNNFLWKKFFLAQNVAAAAATGTLLPTNPMTNLNGYGPYSTVMPPPGMPLLATGTTTYNPFVPCQWNGPVYPNVMVAQSTDPYGNVAQGVANKRSAYDKIGAPVFQPMANTINGTTQIQLAPFVPAFHSLPPTSYVPVAFTSQIPNIPRM